MTYKQGLILLRIVNEGLLDFNGKLKVCIPYHEEVSKAISVPRGEEITAVTKYDEYLIPKRKYEVKAFVLKDDKEISSDSAEVVKKDSLNFIDVYFNKLPEDVLRDWQRNNFHYKSIYRKDGKWHFEIDHWVTLGHYYKILAENSYFHLKYYLHGTSHYLLVYPFDAYVPLEAGFNYELEVSIIEQASFISDRGYVNCVSYPNKYKPAFVEMCGEQDDANDYIYHEKSMPEAKLYFGDKMFYRTIMTGAYKSKYGWKSDTYAKDTFTLKIEQVDDTTYAWKVENFNRTVGKSDRKVLVNIDYRKNEGEFELANVKGKDALGREVSLANVIPLRVVAYSRIGGHSTYPLCITEVYLKLKRVY